MPQTTLTAPSSRGRKKRERTRELLLDAATEVLADRGEGFSVADLTLEAGVSHGTFYNYFADRGDLLSALVSHIVTRFAHHMADEVVDTDPAVRFARISARALDMALDEPQMIRVALQVDDVQRGLFADGPLGHLRQDILDGFSSGRFNSPPDEATLDVLLGSLLLAARRIADGENAASYRCSVLQRLLQALGVSPSDAERLAHSAVVGDLDQPDSSRPVGFLDQDHRSATGTATTRRTPDHDHGSASRSVWPSGMEP